MTMPMPDRLTTMLDLDPFKMSIMDTTVTARSLTPVTSADIFLPNTREFHPDGLFSESIFGKISTPERLTTLSYIDLNTTIIHPEIFAILMSKRRAYKKIMTGLTYAIFDETEHEFVMVDEGVEGSGTGYTFFCKHISKLGEGSSVSIRKRPIYNVLNKYKDSFFIRNYVVMPAGLRDIRQDSSRLAQDDINKFYISILNIAKGLEGKDIDDDSMFDHVKFRLQMQAQSVHAYIMDLLEGKKGKLLGHLGDRKVAFGTRNVLSADVIKSVHVNDPAMQHYDASRLPILQAVKEFQPFMLHYLQKYVFGHVFDTTTTIKAMNSKFETVYTEVTAKTLRRFTTSEGLTNVINEFKNPLFRDLPVSVPGKDGKSYFVLVCHDVDDVIVVDVDLASVKTTLARKKIEFDKSAVRLLTYAEMMYIGITGIAENRHSVSNRYPIIGDGSVYPGKIKVMSTVKPRRVRVVFGYRETEMFDYPDTSQAYVDSVVVHTSRLPGLGGDHDGDTGSNIGVWAKESNENIAEYLNSPQAYINDSMKLKISGASDDIVAITVENMSS